MRGVQDTYGHTGYAYNRISYGALSVAAVWLRLPVDARIAPASLSSGHAGIHIYKSSDSAAYPQTRKPDRPSRSSSSNSSRRQCRFPAPSARRLSLAAAHGYLSSNGRAGVAVSRPAISQRC